jgi:hypothetical protein
MSPDEIKHFLVIYDAGSGDVDVKHFGTDYEAAQKAYAEAERANAEGSRLDIVLLSADSLKTIKRTHSSYFASEFGKLEALLPS